MKVDPLALGREAFEHARCLVELGPRPAGSPAEARAVQWIGERLAAMGYDTRSMEFAFPRLPHYLPYYALAGLAMAVCAALLPVFPWPALFLPLLVALLPDINEALARSLPSKARSINLLALPHGTDLSQMDLLFVAHVDTARAMPPAGAFIRQLRRQAFAVMQRVAVILALVALVYTLRLPVGPAVELAAVTLAGLTGLALLGLDLYDQLGAHGEHTLGAGDNASGVAALLAAANRLGAEPEMRNHAGFLFTGAEEPGLFGARSFAEELRRSGLRPWVVSVDMVGAGSRLRIISGSQTLRVIRTDEQINAVLERADHSAVRHTALRRSGDFLPFLQASIPAGALEADGTPEFWRAYHTRADRLHLVEPAMLGQTAFAVLRMIELGEHHAAAAPR